MMFFVWLGLAILLAATAEPAMASGGLAAMLHMFVLTPLVVFGGPGYLIGYLLRPPPPKQPDPDYHVFWTCLCGRTYPTETRLEFHQGWTGHRN